MRCRRGLLRRAVFQFNQYFLLRKENSRMNYTEILHKQKSIVQNLSADHHMDADAPGNMEVQTELPLLTFPSLTATGLVRHGFTTRLGGVSEGIFSTLNLSFSRGDREDAVRENFRRVAKALGVSEESFVFTDQTHTVNVLRVTGKDAGKGFTRERGWSDIDGLITNEPKLTLSAFFADCVPLYFVDPVNRAIGLSHSGWRGTVSRMGRVTIEAMQKEFGTNPEELICAVGPCICGSCYEIGPEVAEQFAAGFSGGQEEILRDDRNGKYHLDLKRANRMILEEAGVKPENIEDSGICTCCHPDLLFSYRASKGRRGNLGAFLALV